MEKTYSATLFTKSYKTKEGKAFSKYLLRIGEKTFSTILKGDLSARIKAEHWDLPSVVTFSDREYFVKTETFVKDGETCKKPVVVLLAIRDHKPTEFKKVTIEDILE